MSSVVALVDAFFPASAALLPTSVRDALSRAAAACSAPPPPTSHHAAAAAAASSPSVDAPALLALTLASVPFALALALRLERAARRASSSYAPSYALELRLWRDACLLFGGMNAAAALAHCLLPPLSREPGAAAAGGGGQGELAWALRLARAADVAFTGCASTFLVAASFARRAARRAGQGGGGGGGGSSSGKSSATIEEAAASARRVASRVAVALVLVAAAGNAVPAATALAAAAGGALPLVVAPLAALSPSLADASRASLARGQLPFANEIAYLLPTLLAAAFLSLSDVPSPRALLAAARAALPSSFALGGGGRGGGLKPPLPPRQQARLWAASAAAFASVGFASASLDGPCCALLGPRGHALLNGATVLFSACDGAFAALTGYALASAAADASVRAGGGKGVGRSPGKIRLLAVAAGGGAPPGTPAAAAKARRAAAAGAKSKPL